MGLEARKAFALCGVAGPVLLAIYFAAPFFTGWPFNGGTPQNIAAYATAHATLFYAGAWLQAVGTLLSVIFFVGLVSSARSVERPAGLLVIVGSAALLSLVLVEAVLMVNVPVAAAAGDLSSAATAFGLVNGVFARIFPLAPASLPYFGLGVVITSTSIIHRRFGQGAIALGGAFQLAGAVAVFTTVGVVASGILGGLQAIWVVAAAVAYLRA